MRHHSLLRPKNLKCSYLGKRKLKEKKRKEKKILVYRIQLMILMGLLTSIGNFNIFMHQAQTPQQFQRFGGYSCSSFPKSNHNLLLSPSWGISIKSSTLFLSLYFMATHFQVSRQDAVPNQELGSPPSLEIRHHDLLIVGPGVLGRLVAQKWRQEYPGCQVFGQTITTNHHEELVKLGISPSLKWTETKHKFPYVIFCAPPYPSSDYPGDLRQAGLCWNGEGAFLFTSSSAPYDCNDNGFCDEDTPVVPIGRSPRTDVLLKAENVVLEFGGSVVRLSGLYKEDKGAHAYWLEKGIVESRPDHILNLIHYEDAASLSVTILKKKYRGRIFLGCDNHPVSRQEVMDLVNQSGKFSKKFEKFTGTNDPLGKRLNNSRTREELGWEPKYTSFADFLETL